jgi:transposase
LRALVLYLRFTQGIGFERLSRLMSDMFGLPISEGALVNILLGARQRFAAASAAIRARLLSGGVICSDETGLRVGKRSWWLWVFHHGQNACFLTHPRRSKEAVEAFLGAVRPDAWVSDRYGAQAGWAKKDQQVCLAHLLRDTQYVIDEGDGVFAPALRHFIGLACEAAKRRDAWNDITLQIHKRRLERELDRVLAVSPVHPAGVKWKGAIEKLRPSLFVFMSNRRSANQQRIRTCAAALRHLSKNHQRLPLPMGRNPIRRHPIRHRNRPSTIHSSPAGHPRRHRPATYHPPFPLRVSNYFSSAPRK